MNILLDSTKSFDLALADVEHSAAVHGFSVQDIHALGDPPAAKGHPIPRRSRLVRF